MISAKELRIGNWVRYGNRIFKIHCISETYPFLNTEEFGVGVVGFKNIEPIVLCPEILENCGFEEVEGNIYYKFFDYKEFRVFIHKENNSIFMYFKANTVDDTVNNLPLHRLQNIIFALTGEELNYTP